jgi:hypothetical protein
MTELTSPANWQFCQCEVLWKVIYYGILIPSRLEKRFLSRVFGARGRILEIWAKKGVAAMEQRSSRVG